MTLTLMQLKGGLMRSHQNNSLASHSMLAIHEEGPSV